MMGPTGARNTRFDLVVIGGGSAGFAAAIRAAELGASVGLVESGTIGGTCVNVGCIPSKTLIRAAEARHRRSHHPFAGIPATDGPVSWPEVRAQKNVLVAELRQTKYWDVLAQYPTVSLLQGGARLDQGARVRLADGSTLRPDHVVVTTGASPWAPPIPGLMEARPLDSTQAMALEKLPASLVVIGGSAVGLELGQMFSRLGVRVTILEALPTVLPAEGADIGTALAGSFAAEGITVHSGVRITRIEQEPGRKIVHFEAAGPRRTASGEEILIATGRRPNTADLGLDRAGVALGRKGEILVDEWLRTANPMVFAAGDVLGDPMFVYVAAYAGAIAGENALQGPARRYDLSTVPRVVFTDPAVAAVGLTEEEARSAGMEPVVSTLPLRQVPRALAARDVHGVIKLITDPSTRRLLGAQVVASEAGEIITEATLAIRFRLTLEDLTSTFHPYLTLSEGIKLAAQAVDRDVSLLSCCAG